MVKIELRNPRREVEVAGPVRADELCARLGLTRASVLVIRSGELLMTGDVLLADGDEVDIRPVISGGAR